LTGGGDQRPDRDGSSSRELGPILVGLSEEIRRPLESLRHGIDQLLADHSVSISPAEHAQALTMLGLCADLDRLTRESLQGDAPPISA
jgi:hypothetical protein